MHFRSPRFQVTRRYPVNTELIFGGQSVAVELVNVSSTGCCVFSADKLAKNTTVKLHCEVETPNLHVDTASSGVIQWTKLARKDGWLMGMALDEPFSDEFLAQLSHERVIERRKDSREPSDLKLKVKTPLNPELVDASLVNYSDGGFCIETKQQVKNMRPGDRIQIRRAVESGESVTLYGNVVWLNSVDNQQLVGCKLVTREDHLAFSNIVRPTRSLEAEAEPEPVHEPNEKSVVPKWRFVVLGSLLLLILIALVRR